MTVAEASIQAVTDAVAAEKGARQSAYEQALRDLQKEKLTATTSFGCGKRSNG